MTLRNICRRIIPVIRKQARIENEAVTYVIVFQIYSETVSWIINDGFNDRMNCGSQ
ncbi:MULTISPECIES: hypothetical protein [Burkholderia]|uniref:Uncharacterized protein n=1 Tax=Burkholderia paludis TaxID=1506587 RepID=A0A6J5E8D1_9BURK|nr:MULTISPECIES: hypothetical protein [Burkholderia]CAB3762789.1 hypothetical protein LMG30113_04272 [Burkholderia paludis]VWB72176.1 hypothetical protein BPA30113_03258 [Burkholderia paludis]